MNHQNRREKWLIRITLILSGVAIIFFMVPLLLASGIRNAGQIAYANAAFGEAAPITAWAVPLWQNAGGLLPAEQRAAEQRILARAVWASGDDAAAATILGLGAEATPAILAAYFQPDWSAAGQVLPDALAARYLASAAASLATGDEAGAASWIDAALVLRPDDLYANYQRWRLAGSVLNHLTQFTERALLPANADVADFAITIAPALVAERIWSPEQLERAASLWVWKYPELSSLGELLDTQCANQDSNSRWCQLVAERATRLGKGVQGAVAEPSPAGATDTATLLNQLGVPNATPGKSIYRHGAVETWSGLASAAEWGWYDMSVPPEFNAALFTGGIDAWQPFAGDSAARVDGVWQMPDTGDALARAGYWAVPITSVAPGATWLLSFAYRTSSAEPSASVWVGEQPDVLPPEMYLPGTDGEWRREAVLVTNYGATPYDIRPLFRNWGEQTVWFDEFQLQPLSGINPVELPGWKATWESREDEWQDTLAVRYLTRAADAIAADDRRNAILWLDAALSRHPGDLYANYYRRQFNDSGQDAKNDSYLQRLQHFTEAALLPLPPQVAEYTIAVAPKLVADGIWTPEQLVRAARVWVWKFPESPALIALLEAQCADPTAGASWCQLAVERAERRGAGEASVPASTASLEPLLAELGIRGAEAGPSTFEHGAIETWSSPEAAAEWKWSNMVNAPNFNAAMFLGGVDPWQPFAGENAVRVDGLWQTPETGANPARAGFWSVPTQTLPAGSAWLLSFAYRTSGDEPSASVWLSGQPSGIPPELYLPSTAGEWRQEGVLLVNHGETDIDMRPLFRNWGEQTVWFDEIRFQPLTGLDVSSLPDWKITWEYTDELRDVLAARYLLLAEAAIAADDQPRALQWLDAVLDLYPDDLYANYYRRLFTRTSQDTDDPHLLPLQRFTEAGLLPHSPQVAEFTIALGPRLVADGIWTPEQLVRAARLWVWKSPESPALTAILDAQCATQSADDPWCQLVEERTERTRTDEASAEVGDVAPATPPSLQPILTKLEIPDAVAGHSTFKHGAIETWTEPEAAAEWRWSIMVNAPNFNEALFMGGGDPWQPFAGANAVRVDGLWQALDTGPNPARAGFWSVPTQTLPAGSAWLLSFAYRTSGDEPLAAVWVGGQPGVAPPELYLPGTNGEWRQEGVLLVNQGPTDFGLRPLLRNWGEQTVWFDEIQFRPLSGIDVANLPARSSTWEPPSD